MKSKNFDFDHFMRLQLLMAYYMGININDTKSLSGWIANFSEPFRHLYAKNNGDVTVEMLKKYVSKPGDYQ